MPVKFLRSARLFLAAQPLNVSSKLIDDCAYLAIDPRLAPDDPSKTLFYAPPVFYHLFQDDFHWIIYEIGDEHLLIVNIGTQEEAPHLWRNSHTPPQ